MKDPKFLLLVAAKDDSRDACEAANNIFREFQRGCDSVGTDLEVVDVMPGREAGFQHLFGLLDRYPPFNYNSDLCVFRLAVIPETWIAKPGFDIERKAFCGKLGLGAYVSLTHIPTGIKSHSRAEGGAAALYIADRIARTILETRIQSLPNVLLPGEAPQKPKERKRCPRCGQPMSIFAVSIVEEKTDMRR